MDQADSVHSTPRRFTPVIVGGINHLLDNRAQPRPTGSFDDGRSGFCGTLRSFFPVTLNWTFQVPVSIGTISETPCQAPQPLWGPARIPVQNDARS
jgi:hypothetical protein